MMANRCSLSHNPVKLWVLILQVMRRVFKTTAAWLSLESDLTLTEGRQSHQPIVFETAAPVMDSGRIVYAPAGALDSR